MKARAEESLYVGDVYSVDYIGATNAGMRAVLFECDRSLPRPARTPCESVSNWKAVEELKLEAAKTSLSTVQDLMVQATGRIAS